MGSIHIGKIIQKEIKRSKRKVTEVAEELGMGRSEVYVIYKKKSMKTAKLERFSEVLDHNFFKYYSDEFKRSEKKKHKE